MFVHTRYTAAQLCNSCFEPSNNTIMTVYIWLCREGACDAAGACGHSAPSAGSGSFLGLAVGLASGVGRASASSRSRGSGGGSLTSMGWLPTEAVAEWQDKPSSPHGSHVFRLHTLQV